MRTPRRSRGARRPLVLGAIAAIGLLVGATGALAGSDEGAATAKRTYVAVVPGLMTNVDPAVYQGRPFELSSLWTATLMRPRDITARAKVLPGPFAWRPYVATAWKRDRRGNVTFTLRRNVRSSAGNRLTAADVKWSFERMVAEDPIARFLFEVGKVDQRNPITILSSNRVRLNVTSPSALTIGAIHYPMLTVYDRTEIVKHASADDPWGKEWLATHSATFGPYSIVGFEPNQSLTLQANPHHWRKPYFTRIVIRSVPDSASRLQIMLRDQADQTTYLDLAHFAAAKKAKGVRAIAGLDSGLDMLAVNHKLKPFSDVRVRQAIAYAIDRKGLVDTIYRGFGKPAYYQNTTALRRPPGVSETRFAYNPAKARRLLAEAGYADGFSFTATGNVALSGGGAQQELTLIQAMLRKVGIRMDVEMIASSSEFEAARKAEKLEAWLFLSRPAIQDLNYDITLKYTTDTVTNRFSYSNARVDQLTKTIAGTNPGARYNRLVASLVRIVDRDTPAIPLVEVVNQMVYGADIRGFKRSPAGFFYVDEYRRV